jgi:hypothetical protein
MERSRSNAITGMRHALLNPILEELAKKAGLKLLLEEMVT